MAYYMWWRIWVFLVKLNYLISFKLRFESFLIWDITFGSQIVLMKIYNICIRFKSLFLETFNPTIGRLEWWRKMRLNEASIGLKLILGKYQCDKNISVPKSTNLIDNFFGASETLKTLELLSSQKDKCFKSIS